MQEDRKRRQMGYIGSQSKSKRKIPVKMISAKPSYLFLSLLATISILGCGGVSNSPVTTAASTPTGTSTLTGSRLSGQVKGGQQPVWDATIQLYQVGTAGDGSSAAPLGSSTTTNQSGGFTINGDYTCPGSNPLVYLLATGGNPGLVSGTNNTAITLIAALGSCSSLSSSTFINLNEVTTVAAVAALSPYMTSPACTTAPTCIGSGTSDASGLTAAFTLASQYANTATGTSPGTSIPASDAVPSTLINSLAGIVSACVNTTGGIAGDGSNCGTLFTNATPSGGAAPADVATALFNILNSPTSDLASLFALLPSTPPFEPVLTAAPSSWGISLQTITFSSTLPAVTVGTAYAGSVAAIGARGTTTYSLANGALPASGDLVLNAGTGEITGTPEAADVGTYNFSVKVVDQYGDTATSGNLSITILASRPTSQYIFGSQAGQPVPTSGQSWTGLMPRNDVDVWQSGPNTGDTYALMPTTGTLSTLCVNLATAPGSGASWTWTLYKNGSDQSISVPISGSQTRVCDLVDTTGFVPGDLVALHVTPSQSPAPASTYSSWYIVQTPQVSGETILFGSQQAPDSQYLSLAGNSDSLSAEAAMATVIPTAGTMTKYVAEFVGADSSVTATLDQNESPTTLSAPLTSGVFAEQTASLGVSAGDVFDVNVTGITAESAVYASVVFVPDVAGQFVIPTWRNLIVGTAPVLYFPLTGRSLDTPQTNEAEARQIGGNVQIQGVYLRGTTAPGSGAQYEFTLRDNGANTMLDSTLSGTNLTACTTSAEVTGCAAGSAIAVNNFDLLDTAVVPTGSPASPSNGIAVSYLGYVPQLAFTTEPPSSGTAGTVLSPVIVQIEDENGSPVTGSTASVTISSSPAGVSGTLTVNAVNGVATFSNLILSTSGTYTLTAASSGLSSANSTSITVNN
jgi:hypothetical protein